MIFVVVVCIAIKMCTAQSSHFDVGGLYLELWDGAATLKQLNMSANGGTWGKANNFSFVRNDNVPRPGCHNLGDISMRVQPATSKLTDGFAFYSSSSASAGQVAPALPAGGNVLASNDLSPLMNMTAPALQGKANPFFPTLPLHVTRSYERATNKGFVMRFNLTNTHKEAIRLGGLGVSMPAAGQQNGIEESVWNDPHIGADHGWVEWARVVVDEQVLLATPSHEISEARRPTASFEGWRAVMENTCGNDVWEMTWHSEAWAADWAQSQQWPYNKMADFLTKTGMWPEPKTPWPAWHGDQTVPITDSNGVAAPWNPPTSLVLAPGESTSFAVHLFPAAKGPRTRDAALAEAGSAVVHAVPGYVVTPEMKTATLFVQPPKGATVKAVAVTNSGLLTASLKGPAAPDSPFEAIAVQGKSRGRVSLAVTMSDDTVLTVHYQVLPALSTQVSRVGQHWANDAWLPRDYPDPFGRGASVMPWDKETKSHVLDDSRAYDVGLSDDAGGGNPLGFGIKVAYAPVQDEVTRLDDYIKWTLYGVKPDTAKPPLKSLQIRYDEPGMEGQADGIRMTMYYYYQADY